MIWPVMIFARMVSVVARWWSKWGFRVSVICSLGANLVLGLLSNTRRRSASCRWASIGHLALVFFLWGAYQVVDISTTSAIAKLSLSGSDATFAEKQLVAFWAPFLLLHLGGPDNLTAYSLEDSKLFPRKVFKMGGHIMAVGYAIYNYIYRGFGGGGHSSRLLFAASLIVSVSGVTRYAERMYALWKTNLDTMQKHVKSSSSSSSSKEKTPCEETAAARTSWEDEKMVELRWRIMRMGREKQLGDGEALLLAQDLFPIWSRAMVDSSVEPGLKRQLASDEIICSLEWETMCQVAEMELSLMYELLYTKAIVAHTHLGYFIRFMSPLATAITTSLFWFHRHGGGGMIMTRGSFFRITYALLGIALIQDVAWLLRALGSTWTYGYLQGEQTPPWLRHHALHTGKIRWCDIHRIVVRFDPLRLLFGVEPVSYRRWSGTIGRYNLLQECTTRQQCPRWLVSMAGDKIKEIRYLYRLPQCAKKLLFERVKKILMEAIKDDNGKGSDNKAAPDKKYSNDEQQQRRRRRYMMVDIRTRWGQKAFELRNSKVLFQGLDSDHKSAPKFGREFEEDVLCWHIATCIVLPCIRHEAGILSPRSQAHADAIAVMSEYMMFHVAVRREMLPGLVLHSQLDEIREALGTLWKNYGNKRADQVLLTDKDKKAATDDKEELAMILKRIRKGKGKVSKDEWAKLKDDECTRLLADAVELYRSLMPDREWRIRQKKGKKDKRPPPAAELLEFIFNVWVDKLVYASVRCSRESHAKQLSAGGDLTTVLWMVIQHAGPFRMGEDKLPKMKKKISGDEPDTAITPEEATEGKDEDSDEEYDPPIEYITLY